MTEHIKIEKSDGILSLTMARPDKKNALTNAMYGALADAIEGAETDPSVRVLLIRGEGDMFTAGNDVGEFAAIATGAVQGERHVSRFLQALARSSRPLVAAVQGRAVGVGTTMLLHCDLVVLAENALLSTPFVSLALVPEAASSLLMPLRIGYARAYEMFALGEPMDAATAHDVGMNEPAGAIGARHEQQVRSESWQPRPIVLNVCVNNVRFVDTEIESFHGMDRPVEQPRMGQHRYCTLCIATVGLDGKGSF
jgi:enoyl-CoA hydratase/carnithine racemase